MREQNKTPEKELSDKKIANLSNTEFKIPVFRMLRERLEYSKKNKGRNEGYTK